MDFIKAQLDRIQRQLAGLSATQKMLTAALSAIMVITVVWWGKYAGEAEMVPLLNQSFSAADLGGVQQWLENSGIHYVTSGEKILVRAESRMRALAGLTFARRMPHNTQEGFDEIIKQMSPFDPQSKQDKLFVHGKEVLLSKIIGNFPDVVEANVMIDATSVSRIGSGSIEPAANIAIVLRDGVAINPRLVDAAADLVVGAQAGLNKNRVKVVVNGMAQKVQDATEDSLPDGPQQLAAAQQYEAAEERRVRQAFSDIPGLQVSVTVKLNATSMQKETHEYDAKNAIQKSTQETNETDEVTGPGQPPPSEGGTLANTQASVASAASGSQTQTHEKSDTKLQNFVPEIHTLSKTPWGDAQALAATVRVPWSFFVRVARQRNPSVREPTYEQLKPVIDEITPKMKKQVMACLALAPDGHVEIDDYPDAAPELAAAPVAASSASAVSLMVGGHAKEIALGALALMSLFMASMMVRKGAASPVPAPAVAPPQPTGPAPVLPAGEPLAGEAASGDPMLDGMELNEDAVRAQQMVDQVSTMVHENPDGAAALVKRWLNRT